MLEDATSKVRAKGQKLRLLKPLLVRRSGERRSQEPGGRVLHVAGGQGELSPELLS